MRSVGKGSALVPRAREEECTGHGRFPYTGEGFQLTLPCLALSPRQDSERGRPISFPEALASTTQTEFDCLLSTPSIAVALTNLTPNQIM